MFRRIHQTVIAALLLTVTGGGFYLFHTRNAPEQRLTRELAVEKLHSEELKQVIGRLETERRVAKIIVTDQPESAGIQRTTLLFVEYARDGITPLPPKHFTIDGKRAHIDAMVIKFDGKFVEGNDPLRGHSLALFTRIFGETQNPANGFMIDEPGHIPAIYQPSSKDVSQFEENLWANFWKLADDPDYRASMGVRIAQGEGVWRDFDKGFLYKLTLESNGGLNITSERMEGIFQQALKEQGDPSTGPIMPPPPPAPH